MTRILDHWRGLAEFATYEIVVGGPDPQLRYVSWMCKDVTWQESVWRAGVFMAVYNVASAEVIWQHWPWPRVREEQRDLEPWLKEHWTGLRYRKERRSINTPIKLATCLESYSRWATTGLPETLRHLPDDPETGYERLWASARGLHYFGRYAVHKLLELLHRLPQPYRARYIPPMFDLRERGGWSPREALALLYPENAQEINPHSDDLLALARTRFFANATKTRLREDFGLDLGWYQLQTLLCEYHESFHRQYPGRSNDSELKYHQAIASYWGDRYATQMFNARRALLPMIAMGELNGWMSTREELGGCLVKHGYTWSDLMYDFHASKADLDHPVRREHASSEGLVSVARAALVARPHE